ncbi:MAG TPA: iron uptake system protein EfeO [Mycobacteriales bacterium]
MSGATRALTGVAAVGMLAGALAGCGSHKNEAAGSAKAKGSGNVEIVLTDDGCAPKPATVPAGPLTFTVRNDNTNKVSEAEVMAQNRILGEKENLTPGLSGSFSLRLDAGRYIVNCPNAATDHATLTVSGAKRADDSKPELTAAVGSYQRYVVAEVDKLVPATDAFVAAVKSGNVARAKALYAPSRAYYEAVEPVAESFGGLDPAIDARINDVADPAHWTGFHRIEKALWQDHSLAGMTPIANKLATDVATLKQEVATAKLQPAQIANGSVELLGEVAKSKITGEEERYSHTDLWDFEANLDGAHKAFLVLEPALKKAQPQLAGTITRQFAVVYAALGKYRTAHGFVNYATVGAPDRRHLTTVVNALAESLSKVAPAIV